MCFSRGVASCAAAAEATVARRALSAALSAPPRKRGVVVAMTIGSSSRSMSSRRLARPQGGFVATAAGASLVSTVATVDAVELLKLSRTGMHQAVGEISARVDATGEPVAPGC